MISNRYLLFFISLIIIFTGLFAGCSGGTDPDGQLAKQYCGSCHAFPEPSLLPVHSWEKNVLPAMGQLMGIQFYNGHPYKDALAETPGTASGSISITDWQKIVAYYKKNAPEHLPGQGRPFIKKTTEQFDAVGISDERGANGVSVQIDDGNQWVYLGRSDSSFQIISNRMQVKTTVPANGVVVDMWSDAPTNTAAARTGVATNIGILHPNEGRTGSARSYTIQQDGTITWGPQIFDSLPRPVQIQGADFDRDGRRDYLVCGFGNKAGFFLWMHNTGGGYEPRVIRNQPGAIKAYIVDHNKDGYDDIMALFAQGNEGIFLFTNRGDGSFSEKMLLQFPPVYGSSYFELADMNADGLDDIIYTCGDNADYTADVLKPYHGVYIFLNRGNDRFEQKYFFPVNGCYKAVAKDFDGDKDLDMVTIAYFPDHEKQPEESMLYFQNRGRLQFEPHIIPLGVSGNWISMDVGDLDADGDPDVAIAGLLPPERTGRKNDPFPKKNTVLMLMKNRAR